MRDWAAFGLDCRQGGPRLQCKKKVDEPEVLVEFLPIEGSAPIDSVEQRTLVASLQPGGSLDGTMTLEWRGRIAVDRMVEARSFRPDQWKQELQDRIKERSETARLRDYSAQTCDRKEAHCQFHVAYTVPNYATPDGPRLIVPLSFLSSSWDKPLPVRDRRHDLFVRRTEREEETLTFKLPDGYVAENLPLSRTLHSPPLDVKLEVSTDPGTVTVHRIVQTHCGRWERTRYPEVLNLLQEFAAFRRQAFTVRPAITR